jgi:hypothetical protein
MAMEGGFSPESTGQPSNYVSAGQSWVRFCGSGDPPACYTSWAAVTAQPFFFSLGKQRFTQIL